MDHSIPRYITLILASAALATPALGTDKPPCSTMESRPGGAPGWLAWGPVSSGQHVNLLGIPATWDADRALAELESYGFCTSAPATVDEPEALTPLEENHQRLTQPDPTKPDSGLAGLAVVAVVLGALWASRDDDAPLADYRPRPIHQPHQDAQLAPVAPLPIPTPSTLPRLAPVAAVASPVAPVADHFADVNKMVALGSGATRPALVSPEVAPVDVSATMADRLRPTLITPL